MVQQGLVLMTFSMKYVDFLKFKINIMISNIFQTFHRIPNTTKETKVRLEKHDQHKLGQGGYQKLKARIVRVS